MPNTSHSLINYLRTLSGAWRDDPRDDAELLARFVDIQDETAFRILACRHGPMVWQSCKRVLGNTSDAEDAFQVTFMALARQGARLKRKPLAGWLHRVARRTALNAVDAMRRRQKLEQQPLAVARSLEGDVSHTEMQAVIDEELANLPEKLRVPLVLRYLEEKTQEEVARILGCSRSVALRRLARGEALLRERLERRRLSGGIGSVAVLLGCKDGVPTVPSRLIESTAKAAVAFRSGVLTGASANATEKLLRSLSLKGALGKGWWLVLACVGTLGIGGACLVAWKMFGDGSNAVVPTVPDTTKAVVPEAIVELHRKRVDCYGDPLPDGAIARIGTIRFRGKGRDSGAWQSDWNGNLEAGVALSSDSKTLVLADGYSIHFWDASTGKQLHKVVMKCNEVALSPDSKILAAYDKKGGRCIRLLDTATGKPIGNPRPGCGGSAVFSPDGKTVACVGDMLDLYDVDTRKLLRKVKGELNCNQRLTFAQFSRDGRSLACVYGADADNANAPNGAAQLLDVKTGKELAALKNQREVVRLAFTLEGDVVTGGKDKVVRVWDAKTGMELRQLGAMDQVPTVLDLLPDGKTVLAACAEQVRFWNAATGKETRPALACKGMLHPIILSADGTKLIEQIDNAVSIWDVATGKEIGPTAGATRSFAMRLVFSPDSAILLTDAERMVESSGLSGWSHQSPGMAAFYLWDAATGKLLGSLPVPAGTKVIDWSEIAWPSRDTVLAQGQYGSGPGDSYEGMTQWTKIAPSKSTAACEVLHRVSAILSPDGRALACRTARNFELLDVATGKKLADVPRSGDPSHEEFLFFSADHRFLATQLRDKDFRFSPAITLWETSTGREYSRVNMPVVLVLPASPHGEPLVERLIGLSPDGRLIATCNPKTFSVSLWENVSGHVRLRLAMPARCKCKPKVAFSPDNRLLATACLIGSSDDCEESIRVWDLTTGQECQCFHGNEAGTVFSQLSWSAPSIAFSPDGRRLALEGLDYTALIWEVKPPPSPEESSKPLDREELQALKIALTGVDAAAAYRAIGKLRQLPEQAVPLVAELLRPRTFTPEVKQTAQEVSLLIGDLDSDDFQTRTKAARELHKKLSEENGEAVVQSMLGEVLLKEKVSVEVNKAIRELLDELKEERKWGGARSPELARMLRGIEVLELIHTDSAREILQNMVAAPPRPEVRREAEAALKRLAALPAASTRP